jgi:hypothetical protein
MSAREGAAALERQIEERAFISLAATDRRGPGLAALVERLSLFASAFPVLA